MAIRDFLTNTIRLSHLFMLDDSTRDNNSNGIITTGSISAGQGTFEPNPVCEGVNNSLQSITVAGTTGVSNCFVIGNTADINNGTGIWEQYSIMLWFKTPIIDVPTCIYEQGGGTNNMAINVGIAKAITSQAADAGEPFLIAQSKFLATNNRPYYVVHNWQRNTQHAGTGNKIQLIINGVLQEEIEDSGTAAFPTHGGDITVGNSNDVLQSYNGSTQRFNAREKNVNMLGLMADNIVTEVQARELFERTVIPEITISADTVANQQAALDLLIGNFYSKVNCAIRIIQATDATDYRLFIDNILFEQDVNLRDIAIQYVGSNTLTIENTNGSNVVEISTPQEVDFLSNITPGGGSINIVEDTIRLNSVQDIDNLSATKVVIEQPGIYNFNNVVINEVENVSGGQVDIISNLGIATITDTDGTTSVIDSFLSFSGNWELYLTELDRNTSSNPAATGGPTDEYQFSFSPGTVYYLWVDNIRWATEPMGTGETEVNLSTAALLNVVNENLSFIDRVVYCDTRLSINGSGGNSLPYNNLDDAINKFNEGSYSHISLKTDLTTPAVTLLSLDNVKIIGSSPTAHLALQGNSMNSSEIDNILIQGLQGTTFLPSTFKNCTIVGNISGLSGRLENIQATSLTGSDITIGFGGSSSLIGCNITNVGRTIIDCAGGISLAIRNITGNFELHNIGVGSTVSVDSISGNLVLDSSCTDGSVRVFDTIKVIDNSNGTLLDIEDLPTLEQIEQTNILAKKSDIVSITNQSFFKLK